MRQGHRNMGEEYCSANAPAISRRRIVGTSGVVILGVLAGSALGQGEGQEPRPRGRDTLPPGAGGERMEQLRAFSERMRGAGSMEERMKIMDERRAQDRVRAIEEYKSRLGVADQEWSVVKPRIEKVYDLVHRQPQMRMGNEAPRSEVEQRSSELRELLRKEGTASDQIKDKLTALRAAKGREAQELAAARQGLRQIVTVRQEAELVLSALLD